MVGDVVDIEIGAVAFETFFFGSVSRNVGANFLFD